MEIQAANRARLAQISGESRHQGVVAEIERTTQLDEAALRTLVESRLTAGDKPVLLLILDRLQDPRNLGACLRTADAAGVDAVVIPRHGSVQMGPTVSKVAAGAAESTPFAVVPNVQRVMAWLKEYGVRVIGTSDQAEQTVFECNLYDHVAIMMGREESGLRPQVRDRCDEVVRLPMSGSVSSLNVSVASGICLYEAVRQRTVMAREKR